MEAKERKLKLTVSVRLEQAQGREIPELNLNVLDANGGFLAAEPLPKGEHGQVKLELPAELAGRVVRLVVSPRQVEEQDDLPPWMAKLMGQEVSRNDAVSLASLRRRQGFEKRIRLTADAEGNIANIVVFPVNWSKWLLCRCAVRGRLVKRVPLADGTTKELGVCHACVQIYEVDKIPKIILRLPERDLYRLRDDLLRLFDKPLPEPVVFPPPPPPPPEQVRAHALAPAPIGAAPLPGAPGLIKIAAESSPAGRAMPSELESIAYAASASQLRSALLAKAEMLAACICRVHWLWYWFHTDLIKCCCTDEQGRFETTIWYRCAGDKPDLYFKAVQCIGGTLHTLYAPSIACHTHWNYDCGTEVVLETHDPAAITCVPADPVDPPPGVTTWVMPHAVGNIRLDQIKSSGLTDFTDGNGTWLDVPFGSTLGFRLGYSNGIPYDLAGKPACYRWSYNKLAVGGGETAWREFAAPVAQTVVRHYVDYDLAHPDLPPTFPAYPLGPQERNHMNVYEFRPHQPPALGGHKREWPVDDWFADIYSGILNSESLPGGVADAAGKYKIKLEVLDKDGHLLTPGPGGAFDFIVPTGLASDGETILTRKADYTSEVEGVGFVFYLHVDNNACQAEIYEAKVDDIAAGPCGFIGYDAGDDVHLSFKADHPNGFGRFKFTIVRGSSGYVLAACAPSDPAAVPPVGPGDIPWASAPLVSDTPVNGFTRVAGTFAKDVDESAMRGGCQKAAFGENLSVLATATNGWVRLSGLDAYALPKAFALEPDAP